MPAIFTFDHSADRHTDSRDSPALLVTFHSKAWSSVTLFGDVATTLLKMMGHSGTVPGVLPAAGIPAAMARLQQALAATGTHDEQNKPDPEPGATDPDAPTAVGLGLRAYPLVQLLSAAALQDCDVMWDMGAPRI